MKRKLLAIIAVLLILSMACSFLKPKTQPQTSESVEGGDKDDGDQDDDAESPQDDNDSGGGGSQDDDDQGFTLDSGALEQLDYYRSKIVYRFEKGDDIVDETVIEAAYIRDPASQHLIMKSNDQTIEMYKIGDKMWLKFGEEWMQTSAAEGEDLAEGFGDFLMDEDDISDLQGSDYKFVGREDMNDMKTRRYSAKYKQAWLFALSQGSGDVDVKDGHVDFWVADERNLPTFIVRTEYEVLGTVEDEDAKLIMSQDIFDVNKSFTINPPSQDEIGGLPDDVPMCPDAMDVTTIGGMSMFTCKDSVEKVKEFYKDALEKAGWEISEDASMGEMHTSTWDKDGESLQLMISPGEDGAGSSVMIMTGEE